MMINKSVKKVLLGMPVLLAAVLLWTMPASKQSGEEEEASKWSRIADRFDQDFQMMVDPELGTIPYDRMINAMKIAERKRQDLLQKSGILPIYWEERGPNNVGGRTRAILIDANDPTGRTIWAGSVSGGLWRTTNIDAGAVNWTPINDLFQNLAISSIVQDPTNSNLMYFGTGECWGNVDAVGGLGVWASSNGGATWQQLPPMQAFSSPCVNKLIFDPDGTLYACTTAGLLRYAPSDDSWDTVNIIGAASNWIADMEIAANGDYYVATLGDGIYRWDSATATWAGVPTGLPTNGFRRIELACAPSAAGTVYAIYADTRDMMSGQCHSIYRTTNSGDMWNQRTCPANFGSQAWYDLILAVDPNDATRLWAGGVGISISDDGGGSWDGLGGIHPDHHAILYYPGSSDQILFGNDGGVYKSYDGAAAAPSFSDKNLTYNVTQFYAMALHPDAGSNYMLGGTQDNATPKFQNPGINNTSCVLCCCDGGWAFIDRDDPSIQIGSTQNGSFNLSTDGGNTFPTNIVAGDNNRIFITPAEYDDDANVLYYSDLPGWLARVTDISGTNSASRDTIPALGGRTITALQESPTVNNRMYFGTSNGSLFQVDNAHISGGTTFTNLNAPGGGWMSSIAVDTGDEAHILITMSNFGIISIWETYNADDGTSATWTAVEGDLPDMPVRWALFHPFDSDQALVATELGVWSTDDLSGANTEWFPTNSFGLANVRVDQLQHRTSDNLISAATHGRGIYTSDYFEQLENCVPSLTINGVVAPGIYMAEVDITSDATVTPGRGVVYQAGYEIVLEENFHAQPGSAFVAAIQDCGSGLEPDGKYELQSPPEADFHTVIVQPSMSCFPNPATYSMSIQVELPETDWHQLYVKDLRGVTMATIAAPTGTQVGQHQYELDVANFPSGYYVLVLQTAQGAVSKQFIVQH
ncbi:MAG: 3-coathanger stack domain-containing protein [Bacteroidota bacterium]